MKSAICRAIFCHATSLFIFFPTQRPTFQATPSRPSQSWVLPSHTQPFLGGPMMGGDYQPFWIMVELGTHFRQRSQRYEKKDHFQTNDHDYL